MVQPGPHFLRVVAQSSVFEEARNRKMISTTNTAREIRASTDSVLDTASSAEWRSCKLEKSRFVSSASSFEMRLPNATASATALTIAAPSSHVSAVASPDSARNRA
jgi:hypothetical protein